MAAGQQPWRYRMGDAYYLKRLAPPKTTAGSTCRRQRSRHITHVSRQGRSRFSQSLQPPESRSTTTTLAIHLSRPHCSARPMEGSRPQAFEHCRRSREITFNLSSFFGDIPRSLPLEAIRANNNLNYAYLFRYAPRFCDIRDINVNVQ